MSLRTISEQEMRTAGVSSLPARPMFPREMGGRGFTAAEMKEAFDRLPRLVAERYNELVDHVTDGTYLSDIPYGGDVTLRAHLETLTAHSVAHGEDITALDTLAADSAAALTAQERVLDAHETRLDALDRTAALLHALLMGSVIASAEAEDSYEMRQTAADLPIVDGVVTSVLEVTGDTIKSTNLIDLSAVEGTSNGVTVTADNNTLTFKGMPSSNYAVLVDVDINDLRDGEYTFSQSNIFASNQVKNAVYISIRRKEKAETSYTNIASTVSGSATVSFDFTTYDYRVYIISGGYPYTASDTMCVSVAFMCNAGREALLYAPHFDGLKNADFKGIQSTGKNIVDLSGAQGVLQGVTITAENNSLSFSGVPAGTYRNLYTVDCNLFKDGETYTFSQAPYFGSSGTAHTVQNAVYWQINKYTKDGTERISVASTAGGPITITFDKKQYSYIVFIGTGLYAYSASNPMDVTVSFMCNMGASVHLYEGYQSDTSFALSSALALGKWDYIDVTAQKVVRKTATVTFDGTERWETLFTQGEGVRFYTILPVQSTVVPVSQMRDFVVTHYDTLSQDATYLMTVGASISGEGTEFVVYDPAYHTTREWTEHLAALAASGVPLVVSYETEASTEEHLSVPTGYTAWRGGTETILPHTSGMCAVPTVRQRYFLVAGEEVAV